MKYLQRFVDIEVFSDFEMHRHIRVKMFGFRLAHFYIEQGSFEIKRKVI